MLVRNKPAVKDMKDKGKSMENWMLLGWTVELFLDQQMRTFPKGLSC
jgi:hypothetical protein